MSTVWFGWSELVQDELPQRPEVRFDGVGPGTVGRGEAQFDVVAGRPVAQVGGFVRREVVQDDVDGIGVAARGSDGFQRGDGVGRRFAGTHHAPQRVVADRVAAVELSHAVEFVVVRPAALGVRGRRPRGAADGTHRQRPELVEGETPLRVVFEHLLDAIQLGVAVGIIRLLPRLGPLERDIARGRGSDAAVRG